MKLLTVVASEEEKEDEERLWKELNYAPIMYNQLTKLTHRTHTQPQRDGKENK